MYRVRVYGRLGNGSLDFYEATYAMKSLQDCKRFILARREREPGKYYFQVYRAKGEHHDKP